MSFWLITCSGRELEQENSGLGARRPHVGPTLAKFHRMTCHVEAPDFHTACHAAFAFANPNGTRILSIEPLENSDPQLRYLVLPKLVGDAG